MGNCLVTKLKENVNNELLCKVDEFIFDVNLTSDMVGNDGYEYFQLCYPEVMPAEGIPLEIIGNGYFKDASSKESLGKSVTLTMQRLGVILSEGNYKVKVGNKNYISYIYAASFTWIPLNAIKYANNTILRIGDSYQRRRMAPDTRLIPPANTTSFVVTGVSNIAVNMSDLRNLTKIQQIELITLDGSITGEISDLSNLLTLTTLNLRYTAVTGTVESFVQGLRAAQTAAGASVGGTMSLNLYNDGITWRGIPTNQLEHTYTGTLTWTDSTITYNEETINA